MDEKIVEALKGITNLLDFLSDELLRMKERVSRLERKVNEPDE